MPSTADILANAPVACVLAGNDIAKQGLYGQVIDPELDKKIYAVYYILKKIYDLDPSYEGLRQVALYLWEIMGSYGIRAQGYTGTGGQVSPVTPAQFFPIYITEANFTTATFYPNTNIFGNNIIIYLNEINRYLIPNTEFTVAAAGVTITLAGFDATQNTYNLVIEKVSEN